MENLCAELMEEVETQGELSPYGRERLWKMLKSGTDSATAKTKRITLELGCLQKVMDDWADGAPISARLQDWCKRIVEAVRMADSQALKAILPEFYEECDTQLRKNTSFYEVYLMQSIVQLMYNVEDVPEEDLNDITIKDREMEFDEWDAAYCAAMMYAYHNMAVSDRERKRREMEFWDWYIREAAGLQGVTIQTTVQIPEELLGEAETEINSIEDFVKYISYEYDYEKYEIEGKQLRVYAFNYKHGAPCPECGQFSDHVNIRGHVHTTDSFGEMKGWTTEFRVTENSYYCDNPMCGRKSFLVRSKVWYSDKLTHFTKLKSIPGMPEKICALFGIE